MANFPPGPASEPTPGDRAGTGRDRPPDGRHAAASHGEAVAILGFVAAGKLSSFGWLAEDAVYAPQTVQREELSRAAAAQMAQYDDVGALLSELGASTSRLAAGYLDLLIAIDARTQPSDWGERLMRSVIAGGMVRDLDALLAARLTDEHRGRALRASHDPAELITAMLRPSLTADPRLAARLALWGRRVAGEALGAVQPVISALQAVAADSDAAGPSDASAAGLAAVVTPAVSAMSTGHARRMDLLGLTA